MRKFNIFSEVSILGLIFEVSAISVILFFIAYLSNKSDPLLINSNINLVLMLVSIITLYYGFFAGIILIIVIFIILCYSYKNFQYNFFINNLIFVLIFSEFHFFWNKTLMKLKKENSYLNLKFDKYIKTFYTLKISHDQLEKSYILKPNSFRNIMLEIKKLYINKPESSYEEMLILLAKNYGIRRGSIYKVYGNSYIKMFSVNTNKGLNTESNVFKNAIENKKTSFLSEFNNINNDDYLSVIPGCDTENNIRLLLTLEDMHFMEFNKDNIFSISIVLDYFSDYVFNIDENKKLILSYPYCPENILIEIKRMAYFKKKLGITSIIVMMVLKDITVPIDDISIAVSKRLRAIDIICNKENNMFILFPFSSYSNIVAVIDKIENIIRSSFTFNNEKLNYKIIEIIPDYIKTIEYLNKMNHGNTDVKHI
ncbi:MAG: hypothetical protein GX445_03115 [Elusimicrobia bacterium]|nr:hypothetical protein [Elusimicrobiota bacterium]